MQLCDRNMHELLSDIEASLITCEDIMLSVLERIDNYETQLNAYITIADHDVLIEEASRADYIRRTSNDFPKYLGLPISIKDIICTKDVLTTCGSKMLFNFIPPFDATVVRKIKDSGLIIIGKNNCDEFAMGATNETSYYGPVKNPWRFDKISGGSSGGSTAAVAAGESIVSIGTDTGGSIRLPSSHCGVVGLKPTYGRVSRYGITAYASSFDQAGPICKSVKDAALLLEIIAGYDPLDSTSVNLQVDNYSAGLTGDIRGKKIGIPKEYFIDGMDSEVECAVRLAIKQFKLLGAEIIDISLPHTQYAVPTYYILVPAEASSNLARYDGVKYGYRTANYRDLADMMSKSRSEGFGFETKKRILLGTYVLSAGYYDAYYLKAQKVRALIKNEFQDVFKKVDAIACPTSPNVAVNFGATSVDPLQLYLADIFTASVNLAGLPAISLPCGFTKEKLPIGIQLIGNYFHEQNILNLAFSFEQSTTWHKYRALGVTVNSGEQQ